jgi:hypothetical protein
MTAKVLTKNSVLQAVAEGKLGFSFGQPERIDEEALSAVLPILRKTTTKRQYITFPETDQVIVTDSGNIDRMVIENTSKENIFIRSGTIFRGKTQERALTRSTVVFPGQKVSLDVRCVHASKGINAGEKVVYGGTIPLHMEAKSYDDGFRPKDQHTYWNNVATYTTSIRGMSSGSQSFPNEDIPDLNVSSNENIFGDGHDLHIKSLDNHPFMGHVFLNQSINANSRQYGTGLDDLASNMENFSKSFDDILSKIKKHENQVGFALIDTEGCQTIELFDVDQSWSALHTDAVRRVGDKLGDKEPQPFEFKEKTAIENTQWVLSREFKMNTIYRHKPSNGEPDLEITGLSHEKFIGEIVELDGKVVHIVIIRKVK